MIKTKLFIVVFSFTLLIYSSVSHANIINDSTLIGFQPKDTTIQTFNKKQYQKMISRGDTLFNQKKYSNSKKLYQRAIRFQPDWDNSYAENRIIEIDKIIFENAQSLEVFVKEYNDTFGQGITEEKRILKYNNYNEVVAYEIIRVVVIGETYSIYKKHVIRSTVTYSKNGIGVPKLVWEEESNNIRLRWN